MINAPSNYRPITNLNMISKILERLALSRLMPHVISSSSFDPMQSAYRRFYSTGTALLKVTSDIYQAFDHHQTVVLVTLDQSAAFDCVEHNTLLKRLHHTFGITDNALDWLDSPTYSLVSLLSDMDSMIHQFPQLKLESHKVLLWDLYCSHYTFHH